MSLVEIEFKGRRKGIYSNPQEFPLSIGDIVIVAADRGEDMGHVSLIESDMENWLEEDQPQEEIEPILRRANKDDILKQKDNRRLEKESRHIFREFVQKNELEMKLANSEYQFDNKKLTFYFTADGRVDFRELVKDLAQHFRTRIDLRQIGSRDESKRLGGIGICGLELCCCAWIREFQPITTNMVKEQHLLLNPQKNTGLCGRLRCCLRYEVEQYRDVNNLFPKLETKVKGPRGDGIVEKIDMCSQSCGICWRDGNRSSFSIDQMKTFSDWDLESTEPPSLITFKKDPSLQEEVTGNLVASAEPEKSAKKHPKTKRYSGSKKSKPKVNAKNTKTAKRPVTKPKQKQTSKLIEMVEIAPITKESPKKHKSAYSKPGKHRSSKNRHSPKK